MFGDLHFQTKVAQLLDSHFEYNFHRFEKPMKRHFKRLCSHIRDSGGNEADAAASFMGQMIASVNDPSLHEEMLRRWSSDAILLIPSVKLQETRDFVMAVTGALEEQLSEDIKG